MLSFNALTRTKLLKISYACESDSYIILRYSNTSTSSLLMKLCISSSEMNFGLSDFWMMSVYVTVAEFIGLSARNSIKKTYQGISPLMNFQNLRQVSGIDSLWGPHVRLNFSIAILILSTIDSVSSPFSMTVATGSLPGPKKSRSWSGIPYLAWGFGAIGASSFTSFSNDRTLAFSRLFSCSKLIHFYSRSSMYYRFLSQLRFAKILFCSHLFSSTSFLGSLYSDESSSSLTHLRGQLFTRACLIGVKALPISLGKKLAESICR